jgi:hypothetical protein
MDCSACADQVPLQSSAAGFLSYAAEYLVERHVKDCLSGTDILVLLVPVQGRALGMLAEAYSAAQAAGMSDVQVCSFMALIEGSMCNN